LGVADYLHQQDTSFSKIPPYRQEPQLPLESILSVLAAYGASDDVTSNLASLHFDALTTDSNERSYLFLAQAVEVMRSLLRDGKALPGEVTDLFKRASPGWLYTMANYRSSTRHPATKRLPVSLHPEMDPQEQADFLHDADLLARYVVSERLRVPFVVR
jgi:hypothetical protein